MDFKEFLKYGTSAAALLAASASGAKALTITQTFNFGGASVAQGGSSFAGNFDITGLLPGGGQYNQPYDVVSATVTAYGYSAPDPQTVTGDYGSYYVTGTSSHVYTYYAFGGCYYSFWGGGGCYYYPVSQTVTDYYEQRDRTITQTDAVADTLNVNAGSDSFSGAASQHDTNTSSSAVYAATGGNAASGYYYYYDNTITQYDAISGAISVTGTLSLASLADLGADGILPYLISASLGQVQVSTLTLTADVVPGSANVLPTAVPAPAPLGPIGGAMLLLLFSRLQSRRKSREIKIVAGRAAIDA